MQRKLILFLFFFHALISLSAQRATYQHPDLLDVHFSLHNFKSIRPIDSSKPLDAGVGISFINGLNNTFDLVLEANGCFTQHGIKKFSLQQNKVLFLDVAASVRARMVPKDHWLQPYFLTGLGASAYENRYNAFAPTGIGMEIRYKDVFLLLNAQYRWSFNPSFNSGYYYSIGIAGIVSKQVKKRKLQTVAPAHYVISRDRDGDGIMDNDDDCPDDVGVLAFKGCPDSDSDGVEDKKDKCPSVKGIKKYEGCPVPDTDQDSINDEEDDCPYVAGVIYYKGCPVPDSDNDGINDEEDQCIDVPGIKEHFGCLPINKELSNEVESIARSILFETGSHKLLYSSFSALDKVVEVLMKEAKLRITIAGHTDNQGQDEKNQMLNINRADAIAKYLMAKGIDESRLKAVGYGQRHPVATNETKEGRAKNRRVELKLHYY